MPRARKKSLEALFPFENDQPAAPGHRLLLLKYPLFFKAARHPDELPCDLSHWGIRCGPGWLPVLDTAIEHIERELQTMMRKWDSVDFILNVERRMSRKSLTPLATGLTMAKSLIATEPTLLPYCREISVNELGGLHIEIASGYLCDEASSHAIEAAVFAARMMAGETCERCGAPGHGWRGYWRRIYCVNCAGMESVGENDDGHPGSRPPSAIS
jgi:hypothetical protein